MRLPSQRPVCRTLFLLCCVAPTLGIAGWSLLSLRPGNARRFADRLSVRTGLHVELDRYEQLRPRASRLTGLRLIEPESRQPIAHCDRVGMVRGNGRILVSAEGTEIQRDQLLGLWDLFHDRVLRQTDDLPSAIHVLCRQLTLRGRDHVTVLKQVRGELEQIAAGPKATWRFRLADSTEPVEVAITRDHRHDRPTTRFVLDTGPTPLPCSLFHPFSTFFRSLGSDTTFQGHVWTQRTAEGWEGEVTGRLSGVELAELLGRTSRHRLTGPATVLVRQVHFRGGQIDFASGSVTAGPGQVSGSLVAAVVEVLGLSATSKPLAADDARLPYRSLEFGFAVESTGLTLYGLCRGEPEGTIMADSQGPVLGQPAQQPVPVVSLVRALVPQHRLQVPAARETLTLLRLLPLPRVATRSPANP